MKMKGVLAATLAAVLCISGNLLAYSGGDGLSEATAYQISSPADWETLMATPADWGDHFILTDNIDLDGVTITPVGNYPTEFTGTFDGDGHTISNLSYSVTYPRTVYCIGLFGDTWGATIKNVTLTNVMISPDEYDNGSLIGRSSHTTITNCHSSGLIFVETLSTGGQITTDTNIGGLVGSLSLGTMTNCSSTCSVIVSCYTQDYYENILSINIGGLIGDTYEAVVTGCFASGVISAHAITNRFDARISAGGFVGSASGTFTNCYSRSSVSAASGSHSYFPEDTVYIITGGFAGYGHGTYTNCYSTGSVSASSPSGPLVAIGGFMGSCYSQYTTITSTFWDTQTTEQTESSTGKGLTTAQMKTMSIFQNAGWGEQGWVIQDGVDYPRLSWEGSGGTAIPAASPIPLSGSGTQADPYLVTSVQEFASLSWYSALLNKHLKLTANLDMTGVTLYPIGDLGIFTGVFDGDGHTISNVTIHHSKSNWTGLFASLSSSGQLLNLGVIDVDITGNDYVGGLVGIKNASSIVTSCYTTGSVNGNRPVGGLVGYNYSGSINFSHSACTVQGSSGVGGLVGDNAYGPVSFCYATGSVNGTTRIGGLAGANGNTITNCYATGSARGNSFYNYTGGLVGYNDDTIHSCYSTGPVSSGDPSAYYVGGLAGYTRYSWMIVSSFWDRDTSGREGSEGGTGKNTSEMKTLSTFTTAGWDFSGTDGDDPDWYMEGVNYPQLNWQLGTTLVPNVAGMTQSAAQSTITSANLATGTITLQGSDTIPAGTVISQSPAVGLEVYYHSAVNLVVSAGIVNVVPDLYDLYKDDAELLIYENELTLGTVRTGYDRSFEDGHVFEQSPAAGTLVPTGTAIHITIAPGEEPFYVWTAEQFNSISQNSDDWGAHFILTADIDMSAMTVTPVWEFSGIFNGNGHTISNVMIQQPNDEHVGLFGTLSGQINNLNLVDVDILGLHHVGGLAGENSGGTIYACSVTGSVSGQDGSVYVGGLCGNNGGTLSSSFANCSVAAGNASSNLGGLCGINYGTITNCYAQGPVLCGENSNTLGGLCGTNEGTIRHCFTACNLQLGTDSSSIGGLCGEDFWEITNSFWDIDTSGLTEEYFNDMGISTSQMQTQSTFTDAGWDFSNADGDIADWIMSGVQYPHLIWETTATIPDVVGMTQQDAKATLLMENFKVETVYRASDTIPIGLVVSQSPAAGNEISCGTVITLMISAGSNYAGSGTATDPYRITNKYELLIFATTPSDYSKCFVLTADIDLDGEIFTTAVIAPDTNNTIFNTYQGTPFTGVFDGNGKKISNLTIIDTDNDSLGLFGFVGVDGRIKNIGLVNANIHGHDEVGGLAGWIEGEIAFCYATGSVSGRYHVGGLVGFNGSGTVTSCYATSAVSGTDSSIGGLVGQNISGTITSCHATGTVSAADVIGGLVGYSNSGTITSCYATGAVSGTNNCIGGLVGFNNSSGTITSCYATGAVSGSDRVGGLAGWIDSGTISSCYATGAVSGIGRVGGLTGVNNNSTINFSFWDTDTSELSDGVGNVDPDPAGVTGKTTTQMQMQATFTGWDFVGETANGSDDIWRMCVDGVNYPKLNWESIDGDFACPAGVDSDDLDYFFQRWLFIDCTADNNFCGGADMNTDERVDLADFAIFADHWLEGI